MNVMLAYKALAAVLAVAVALAGMGGGAVLAAADTLPGDVLYPVKLLTEDIRLALTPDPAARAELEMNFVDLRVQEMARLAQQGEEIRQAEVERMTRQMEQVMMEIARARPEEAPALMERLIERTRLHQRTLEDALTEKQTRLWEAIQLMERTRLNAENDPKFLEYLYQHRYEGTQGPHGQMSPTPQGAGQQIQEQNRQSYEGTPGPHGEATPSPQQQQMQQEEQQRYEGTAGPHGQGTPTATPTPHTEQQGQQYQNGQEGAPGPQGEQPPSSGGEPQPTHTPQQSGPSNNGH